MDESQGSIDFSSQDMDTQTEDITCEPDISRNVRLKQNKTIFMTIIKLKRIKKINDEYQSTSEIPTDALK